MHRDHFVVLEQSLSASKPGMAELGNYNDMCVQWRNDVRGIASACASFNPRFDRTRFLTACGMDRGDQ